MSLRVREKTRRRGRRGGMELRGVSACNDAMAAGDGDESMACLLDWAQLGR